METTMIKEDVYLIVQARCLSLNVVEDLLHNQTAVAQYAEMGNYFHPKLVTMAIKMTKSGAIQTAPSQHNSIHVMGVLKPLHLRAPLNVAMER